MLFPESDNWRAAMRDVSAAIDETMGELVTVTPARADKPNFPTVADASEAVTVTAVFTNKAKSVLMGEGRIGGHSISPLVETSEPAFTFGYGVMPFPLEQGYRITRMCSGATYEIKNVMPDGVSRIVCSVVMLGVPRSVK